MEWERLVLHALGVPAAISEHNRVNAAVWRLLGASPDELPAEDDRVDAAQAISAVVETARAGLLDGMLGGWETLAETVVAVGARVGTEYRNTDRLLGYVREVLEKVAAFVEAHPFWGEDVP